MGRREARLGRALAIANLLIKDVTLIDGTGAPPRAGTDVLIQDGLFAAFRSTAPGEEAEVLDGSGKFLVPGLWESHTHLRPILKGDEEASQAALDDAMRAYLRRGITTVVDLGGPTDVFHRMRDRHRTGGIHDCARLLFAGPSFTGIGGWPLPLHHNPAMVNQAGDAGTALAKLRALLERRPDVIKVIYDGEPGASDKLPRQALEAIVAEAHRHGKHVLVHIRTASDALDALEAGADGVEHTFVPDGPEEDVARATELLARSGAYLTPTLAAFEQLGRAGDRAYLDELAGEGCLSAGEVDALTAPERAWGQAEFPHHPKVECRARVVTALRIMPRMQAAGVKWAAGSDIAPVLSRPEAALRELVLLARAGVPLMDVISAGSRHAAEKVGAGDRYGTIEPGKVADALLLDADPLADVRHLVRPEHLVSAIKDGHQVPTRS